MGLKPFVFLCLNTFYFQTEMIDKQVSAGVQMKDFWRRVGYSHFICNNISQTEHFNSQNYIFITTFDMKTPVGENLSAHDCNVPSMADGDLPHCATCIILINTFEKTWFVSPMSALSICWCLSTSVWKAHVMLERNVVHWDWAASEEFKPSSP